MTGAVLRVRVRARQRLLLGVGSEVAYFTGSHSFVPGSVLRGALAAAWITEHGPPTGGGVAARRFRNLFDGKIRYGPLHVPGSVREPISVWRCKYRQTPRCEQVAVDRAFESGEDCPQCGRRLEQCKGELILPEGTRLLRSTRTSIDPDTGRAKDGELYAHDGLPADTVLTGVIFGTDEWLAQPRTLRLGGRRTVSGAADYQTEPTMPERPGAELGGSDGALVVRLVTPAVFVDTAGRPRPDPDPTLDLDGLPVAGAWTRSVACGGWHAASRLPKPAELCAEAGSTYLVRGDHDRLVRLAHRIVAQGVGLRRVEGFGVARVVTTAWRPPAVVAAGAARDELLGQVDQIQQLRLERPQQRWLIGVLRSLQIEQHRCADAPPGAILDELLEQPTAAGLSGRQREQIRTIVAGLDRAGLRDLTTMVAGLPPPDTPPHDGQEPA